MEWSEEGTSHIIIQGKRIEVERTASAKTLRCYILGMFKKQQQQVDQIAQTTIDDH